MITDSYHPEQLNPLRKRWTRAECAALETSGVWAQQRLELVDGELISKRGKKRPHVNSLTLALAWLVEVFGKELRQPGRPD